MEKPVIVEAPPNDPNLGSSIDNPGESCIDIAKNGGPPNTGLYWVHPNKDSEPFLVYCD